MKHEGTQEFENSITYISTIDSSFIISFGNVLNILAPFHLDRPLGGIQFLKYEHNIPVLLVSSILGDFSHFSGVIPENIKINHTPSLFVLFVDVNHKVSIIDLNRQIEDTIPEKLDVSGDLISICGSLDNPFEFVILDSRSISVCKIHPIRIEVLQKINFEESFVNESFFKCLFFCNHFLFQSNSSIYSYENNQLNAYHKAPNLLDFKISRNSFCILRKTINMYCFDIPGKWSKCILEFNEGLWAFDDPYVGLIIESKKILIFNTDTDIYICKELPRFQNPQYRSLFFHNDKNILKCLIQEEKSLTLFEISKF